MRNQIFNEDEAKRWSDPLCMERPRLRQLLEKSIKKPLTFVTAGAGCGKTQAVRSFTQSCDAVTLWLRCCALDNVESGFWKRFIHMIAAHNKMLASRLLALGFPKTDRQFEVYMELLVNEIRFDLKYVVVLDDFHLIRSPAVLDFLEKFLNLDVPNCAKIVILRGMPGRMAGMLSKDRVAAIGEEDLRLNEGEIYRYFYMQGVQISPRTLSDVCKNTEGWAFAVYLTGVCLKKEPVREEYALAAVKSYIFQWIEAEGLSSIPEDGRRFLIQLPLLDRWFRGLLEWIAPDLNVTDIMGKLGVLIRYDDCLDIYRAHPLFAEYLTRGHDWLTRDEKRDIYGKAACWCIENHYVTDAVAYYEKVGDYKGIVEVAGAFPQIMPEETARCFLETVERMPKDRWEEDPSICIALYILHPRLYIHLGRFEEAAAEMAWIIKTFEATPRTPLGCYVLVNAYTGLGLVGIWTCARTGRYDFKGYFEEGDRYVRLIQGRSAAFDGETHLGVFPEFLGVPEPAGAWSADMSSASRRDTAFLNMASLNIVYTGAYICKTAGSEKGEMERFIEALEDSLSYVSASVCTGLYGVDDLARAELAYYRDDLKHCEMYAYQALYKSWERGPFALELRALFFLLKIYMHAGDYAGIRELDKRIRPRFKASGHANDQALYDMTRGWFLLLIGQADQVADWLKSDFDKSNLNPLMNDFKILIKTRYYLSKKKYHVLWAFLKSLKSNRDIDHLVFGHITLRILETICLYYTGEQAKALIALRAAYEAASVNALDMLFVEFCGYMRPVFTMALKDETCGIPKEWLERIYKRSAVFAKRIAHVADQYRNARGLGPEIRLTLREMEILKDLYDGLSRTEIAVNRNMSVNTVKSALQIIYAKLGAENNIDAIRIAIETRLIQH
jgi:LuxR family maltose regulon positive regulatory protein